MKKLFLVPLLICLAFLTMGATIIVKISEFPNTTTPGGSDLFILASGSTNKNISWNQLKEAIGTNPASVTILNNLFVSNVYATNITTTNLTVNNEFHGKTTITTNLYIQQTVTNYFLFSTNLYLSYPTYTNNTYVSNYFQTNAFLNTYISNFFNTNLFNYYTNIYQFSTNLTVTNFYKNDTYVSNFFNTNIFNNNSYVSNFFATNIYNTYNISSNYLYQFSTDLTNPVMYGTAMLIGYPAVPEPIFQVVGSAGYSVSMDGKGGDIFMSGSVFASGYSHYEDDWLGPTNSIDMSTSDQYFKANSDCKITGLINPPDDPQYTWEGLITITNSAATNITLRFPASIIIPERTTSVTISNASQGMFSLKYHHRAGTNGVFRLF